MPRKKTISFGQAALNLLQFKQAILDAGLQYKYIKAMQDNWQTDKSIRDAIQKRFADPSWYQFQKDEKSFSILTTNIDKQITSNLRKEIVTLWTTTKDFVKSDADYCVERDMINDLWIDFHPHVLRNDGIKEPSSIQTLSTLMHKDRACYHAAQAYAESYILNEEQAQDHMKHALKISRMPEYLPL